MALSLISRKTKTKTSKAKERKGKTEKKCGKDEFQSIIQNVGKKRKRKRKQRLRKKREMSFKSCLNPSHTLICQAISSFSQKREREREKGKRQRYEVKVL